MKITFGQWLKAALKDRGITQTELARRIGVQPPQVSHIIAGDRGTTPENMLAISHALKISAEEVFRAAGLLPPNAALSQDGLSPKKRELLHMAEEADDETVELILDVLRSASERRRRQAPSNGQLKKA